MLHDMAPVAGLCVVNRNSNKNMSNFNGCDLVSSMLLTDTSRTQGSSDDLRCIPQRGRLVCLDLLLL
jgi:hypothetical protein